MLFDLDPMIHMTSMQHKNLHQWIKTILAICIIGSRLNNIDHDWQNWSTPDLQCVISIDQPSINFDQLWLTLINQKCLQWLCRLVVLNPVEWVPYSTPVCFPQTDSPTQGPKPPWSLTRRRQAVWCIGIGTTLPNGLRASSSSASAMFVYILPQESSPGK